MIESAYAVDACPSAAETRTPAAGTTEPEGPAQHLPGNSMWTVSAVVVDADGPSPRPGVVASANLGDAAEQLCEYLPRAGAVDDDCYLVAREVPQAELHVQELPMAAADLHYRGFSRMYRKGGRYGPHWFDYQEVNEESPWRPITGAFTRFGDVLSLLTEADDKYVVMAPGDETTIEFETGPDTAGEGWQRDFLLYTVGWIKDSDLNTAFGDTVEPLPFHGIKEYPYAPGESYPDDPEHQRYLREYNTRIVTRR